MFVWVQSQGGLVVWIGQRSFNLGDVLRKHELGEDGRVYWEVELTFW